MLRTNRLRLGYNYIVGICRPYRRVVQRQCPLTFQEIVMGVAILQSKVFIIFDYSRTVSVYDANFTEMFLDEICIPDMQWPQDIVACCKTEKVYIADMQNHDVGCVWRLSTEGDFDAYLSSSREPGLWPRSLAAARGYLLVVSHPNVLLMYGVGGRRIRRMELPRDMEVQHAVVTDHNTFVVGLSKAENTLVLLREVDFQGHTVRICSVEFKLPVHLSVDPWGHVIVADRLDDRVVLLDKRLDLKRVLLAKNLGGEGPRRLLLLPELGQLYICELRGISLWMVGMRKSRAVESVTSSW